MFVKRIVTASKFHVLKNFEKPSVWDALLLVNEHKQIADRRAELVKSLNAKKGWDMFKKKMKNPDYNI